MLSYKNWKSLNESILPNFNLGISNPSNLGVQTAFAMELEEAKKGKKKSKKKMFGGEDETGDGEMVKPASEKDEPDVDVKVGEDDDEECGKCDKKDKGDEVADEKDKKMEFSKKKSKKKMGSDGEDEMEMKKKPVEKDMGDDEEDHDDEDGDEEGEMKPEMKKGDKETPMFSKKKSKKKLHKEETEEEKWWSSVKSMTQSNPDVKYNDGWTEYQSTGGGENLFTPVDTDNLTQAMRPQY